MSTARPIITYQDDDGLYPQIAEELAQKLPLTNLQWRVAHPVMGKETVRVVDSLDVDVKKLSVDFFPATVLAGSNIAVTLRDGGAAVDSGGIADETPASALAVAQFPFLHLFLVGGEDVEAYRAISRKRIASWLAIVGARKHQDWAIVYVAPPATSKVSIKFLTGRTTVVDKLRNDYGSKRVLVVRPSAATPSDAEAWAELVQRITAALHQSFQGQADAVSQDITKSESQRLLPGWNFCQHFLQKEKLAEIYEVFGLADLALVIYDELEDLFAHYARAPPAVWFKEFGGCDPGDDALDVLAPRRKPYRQQLISSDISVFDFCAYVFARQSQLLFRLNRPDVLCTRAKHFVTSLGALVSEHADELPLGALFLPAFVYAVCTSVVLQCEEHTAITHVDEKCLLLYDGAKAELLWYARLQLDALGVAARFLPCSAHASPRQLAGSALFPLAQLKRALAPSPPQSEAELDAVDLSRPMPSGQSPPPALAQLSTAELRVAFESQDRFDSLYLSLTERAIKGLQASGTRPRTMWLLRGDVAFLHYVRGGYVDAKNILMELCLKHALAGLPRDESALLEPAASSASLDSAPDLEEVPDELMGAESTRPVDQHTPTETPPLRGLPPFQTAHWHQLSIWFLELLADCADRLGHCAHLAMALLELLCVWCARRAPSKLGVVSAEAPAPLARIADRTADARVQHWLARLEALARGSAGGLPANIVCHAAPFLELRVERLVQPLDDDGPLELHMAVASLLPSAVTLDRVAVRLAGSAGSDLVFERSNLKVAAAGPADETGGVTRVILSCARTTSGTYFVLDAASVRLGRLFLHHSFLTPSAAGGRRRRIGARALGLVGASSGSAGVTVTSSLTMGGRPVAKVSLRLRDARDPVSLAVRLSRGLPASKDGVRRVTLVVRPRHCCLRAGARLSWQSPDGAAVAVTLAPPKGALEYARVRICPDGSVSGASESPAQLVVDPTVALVLPACPAHHRVEIDWPLAADAVPGPTRLVLQYVRDDSGVPRVATADVAVPTDAPVALSATFATLPTQIVASVLVANNGTMPVRLRSVELQTRDPDLASELAGARVASADTKPSLVWPAVPSPVLYRIPRDTAERLASHQVTATATFTTVQDEAVRFIEDTLDSLLTDAGVLQFAGFAHSVVRDSLVQRIDWNRYALLGRITMPVPWTTARPIVQSALAAAVAAAAPPTADGQTAPASPTIRDELPDAHVALVTCLEQLWTTLATATADAIAAAAPPELVHTLVYPVSLPAPRVLVTAVWELPEMQGPPLVGLPLACRLVVCARSWRKDVPESVHLPVALEFGVDRALWAFSGRVLQTLTLTLDPKGVAAAVVLVPLVAGNLPLPRVSVRPDVAHPHLSMAASDWAFSASDAGKQLIVLPRNSTATLTLWDTVAPASFPS